MKYAVFLSNWQGKQEPPRYNLTLRQAIGIAERWLLVCDRAGNPQTDDNGYKLTRPGRRASVHNANGERVYNWATEPPPHKCANPGGPPAGKHYTRPEVNHAA